uniref:SAM domain-containing protein n=1 Tax=Caenorhabditis tropicalis TaxID=1561998 RepID=A0A1I7V2V2_9PELO
MEAWTQFFVRAGIPKDIAQKYAKSFHNNRITKEMLPELDKSTLSELGVTAIGDQLCILRRIKAAKSAIERGNDDDLDEIEAPQKAVSQRTKITGPSINLTGISGNSEHRRGKPPPDRHEIYHVKMPVGNTHRTRQIMQKAEQMREQGLAVRGTTGVRQGGRSVSPIDKSSLAARMQRKQISEVSSSTDRRQAHLKIARIATSGIKKTISNRPSLSSRLTSSSGNRPSGSSLRIQVDQAGRKMSRIEGRIQKIPASGVYLADDDEDVYEMEDVEEYPDEEMAYEEEVEEYEEVVTVPVHQRITYGQSSSSGSGRLQSTVQRAPPRAQTSTSSSYRSQPRHVVEVSSPSTDSSVFSRISYHNRR